ncbi:MAG: NAD(P)H-dependent oxidoreductase [Planctomycetes bacterium]|nr:NAD(P)H-dependent oxidoreductase [Planctomycetota bacterium]
MTTPIRILAFAGSLRRDSWNKKLVRVAAQGARDAGAEVSELDLKELDLPLYDGDLERASGLPAGAQRFKQLLRAHHGFLVASPEYNSSISGVLKNAIDWATRAEPGEPALAAFDGKVAGLLSASPGPFGGVRGLLTVRAILSGIRVIVAPDQTLVPKAHEAFDAEGRLTDARHAESAQRVGARVVDLARALSAAR